jgi:hypothetical protein
LPRAYKLRFPALLLKDNDADFEHFQQQKIIFGSFGSKDGGISLSGLHIDPSNVNHDVALKTCSFKTRALINGQPSELCGYINFATESPTGNLSVNEHVYDVVLDPEPLWFTMNVSANAGAVWSSGKQTLLWDTTSDAWKNATWEEDAQFGYDVVSDHDPVQP